MNLRKNILLSAALALNGAAPLFAGPAVYSEAAAPWTSEQALKLPPAITREFLEEVKKDFGAGAAAGLAEKKEKVSALVGRFRACALNAEDLKTAGKYFTPEFKAEVSFFAGEGCAGFKESAEGRAAGPRSASLDELEGLSASGVLATSEGSARFFDGSKNSGGAAVQIKGGWSGYRAGRQAGLTAPSSKPLSSNVPVPRSESRARPGAKTERPENLGKDGRVNRALEHWKTLRRQNWAAYKKGDLAGAEKARVMLRIAAGAGLGALLVLSNLPNVEIAAARLRWDVRHDAGAKVIAADSARLAFHSALFLLALLPVPITDIFIAAAAGEAWAVAYVAAMGSGIANNYIFHVL